MLTKMVVTIEEGHPNETGKRQVIARVPSSEGRKKVILFRDENEVELPKIGEQVEIFIVQEHPTYIDAVFLEEHVYMVRPKYNESLDSGIKQQNVATQAVLPLFDTQVKEVTNITELNNFLSGGDWKLFSTHVLKDQIIYVIHRHENN